LQRFDFGRSSPHSGTYNFKKQWGALEESLHWQANVAGGDLLNAEHHQGLQGVVAVWKHLPRMCVIGPFAPQTQQLRMTRVKITKRRYDAMYHWDH
jgi:hypothetical protein